jgi:2-methylcitrate dehydratase PrpD
LPLIDGEITDRQFEPERFKDPEVWKFLENVKVERNAELSAMYPDAVGNIVHVDLADGRRLTRRVDYPLGEREESAQRFGSRRKAPRARRAHHWGEPGEKDYPTRLETDEAKNVDELAGASGAGRRSD